MRKSARIEKIKKAIDLTKTDLEKYQSGQLVIDFNGMSIGVYLKIDEKRIIIPPSGVAKAITT